MATHNVPVVKAERREGKAVVICPHCGKEIKGEQDLYRDVKGYIFHRPCFRKGKGSIKLASIGFKPPREHPLYYKIAAEGSLGSGAETGQSATVPPRLLEPDGSTPTGSELQGAASKNLLDQCEQPPDPTIFDVGLLSKMAAVPETGINLPGDSGPAYQDSSSIGAQGKVFSPSSAGTPTSTPQLDTISSAQPPVATSGDEDVKMETDSTTPSTGPLPHLNA